jgi:uncharacterized protein YqgC (DUF456 family)
MPYAVLVLAEIAGLLMIPLGLPGLWVQALALAGYGWYTGFTTVGWWAILLVIMLAVIAEALEFVLGGRYAAKYGGSRRAAWGAILGGLVGAVVGVPIAIVGSVIGAFVGSFLGAMIFELSHSWRSPEWRGSMRVGWGAMIGRLVAATLKSGIGVVIAAIALFAAL